MHFHEVPAILFSAAELKRARRVNFVSPAISTTLAAASAGTPLIRETIFAGAAQEFVKFSGLVDVLAGQEPNNQRGPLHGKTYSKLTRLETAHDVDRCNSVIVDLLSEQLPASELAVATIGSIVGELHDNVASHAKGAGYSAAQVYTEKGNRKHIEFAVADSGCGMLYNVVPVMPDITTHEGAIQWCIGYKNTTARPPSDWAQRLPDDCAESPFPPTVETFSSENHHSGLGLWKLVELVKQVTGGLWIWSGNAQLTYLEGSLAFKNSLFSWPGVAIEVSFDVGKVCEAEPRLLSGIDYEQARRLGSWLT